METEYLQFTYILFTEIWYHISAKTAFYVKWILYIDSMLYEKANVCFKLQGPTNMSNVAAVDKIKSNKILILYVIYIYSILLLTHMYIYGYI